MAEKDQQLPKSGEAIKKVVQRIRVKAGGHVAVPQSRSEVASLMPEKYEMTAGGSRFFRANKPVGDDDNERSFMLFISPGGIDILKQSSMWFADGTFRNEMLCQLNVTHFIIFSNFGS